MIYIYTLEHGQESCIVQYNETTHEWSGRRGVIDQLKARLGPTPTGDEIINKLVSAYLYARRT